MICLKILVNIYSFKHIYSYLQYFFTLIIIVSCSKPIELKGDWKMNVLLENNIEKPSPVQPPIISFRSDNLVFYFNTLMVYELEDDSLFLAYEENPEQIIRAFKIDFIDSDHINLSYLRKVPIDSFPTVLKNITLQSQWSKIN